MLTNLLAEFNFNLSPAWIVGLTAVTGVLASFWRQALGVFQRLRSLIIRVDTLHGHNQDKVMWWLRSFCHTPWLTPQDYGFRQRFNWHTGKWLFSLHRGVFSKSTYWYRGRPLWVEFAHPKSIKFSYLRGLFRGEDLFLQIQQDWDRYEEQEDQRKRPFGDYTRHQVFHMRGQSKKAALFERPTSRGSGAQGGQPPSTEPGSSSNQIDFNDFMAGLDPIVPFQVDLDCPERPQMENLALNGHATTVYPELRYWLNQRTLFRERGIPWTRKLLFQGPPGTGKSSLAIALAHDLNLPIYVFHLGTMDDAEFLEMWNNIRNHTHAIAVLFEDLHILFNGDKSVGTEVTVQELQNVLGGVEPTDGIVVFMTTNDTTVLPTAFGQIDDEGNSSRPGRIDRSIYMGPMTRENRLQMLARMAPELEDQHEEIADAHPEVTGCQFQDICYKLVYQGVQERYREPAKLAG